MLNLGLLTPEERSPARESQQKRSRGGEAGRTEIQERILSWCRMAAALAKRHPDWRSVDIAIAIQRSAAGKKWGGPLTYSVDNIRKHISCIVPNGAGRAGRAKGRTRTTQP